jgi:peptidoglycan/LPS O-acetylase OafA/YrhL
MAQTAASSDEYCPVADGVGVIAVPSVIFHDARISFFVVGYVGVDIFIGLSGYLTIVIIAPSAPFVDFETAAGRLLVGVLQ